MHIIESIEDDYLICDCCGDRIAPDEVAIEKTDKEGRIIHICIDCENYATPEMEDLSESIEDDLARIESGGFEAFRDDEYEDHFKAEDIHNAAQDRGMSDLEYVNAKEKYENLYVEDEFIADLETYGLEKDCIDYYIDDDLNDVHRPLQDQMEDLINDEEFIQYDIDIPSKLRDDIDDNIYEISDGEYHTLDEMLLRLEKYKHDKRTPLCSALYNVLSKVKDELCSLT